MTKSFRDMLELLGYICKDTDIDLNITSMPDFILEKAREQGVYHLVFGALKIMHNQNKITLENFNHLNNKVMLSCNKNALKISSFYPVITKFEEEKITYALLKGDTLSSLYRFPGLRISGDIDVLVDEKDEMKVLKIMSEYGFTYSPRSKSANHTVCYHPLIGVVEIHISLYYDFITTEWFGNHGIKEEFRKIKLSDGNYYYTLGVNDGYIYIVLHAIKHFLANGITMRQMMDVVLYAEKYVEEIDFNSADKLFEKLKYKNFVECIFYIANKYWNIDVLNIDKDYETIAERILSDCEESGAFGKKKKMSNFYEIYNRERIKSKGNVDFEEYMTSWRRNSLKDYLSLSKESMRRKYPSLNVAKARKVHIKNIIVKCIKYKEKIPQFIKYRPVLESERYNERLNIIKELDMI